MRRSLLIALLASTILVAVGFAWKSYAAPAPYRPLGPGNTYLALGDSLAAGFTVGDPAQAYVARIERSLQQLKPGIAVNNLSLAGETSVSFRAYQLPRALAFIAAERKAGRRISPITIDIGGNDARNVIRGDRAERSQAMKNVEENLGVGLDRLLRATADRLGRRDADIVVMNYYNPYGGDPADPASSAYWMVQLNQAIARAAAARAIPVADVASAFGGGLAYRYTYVTTGDIHANADGHRVIAAQFWKALGYRGATSAAP